MTKALKKLEHYIKVYGTAIESGSHSQSLQFHRSVLSDAVDALHGRCPHRSVAQATAEIFSELAVICMSPVPFKRVSATAARRQARELLEGGATC